MKIAIIGSDGLLGRELREQVGERGLKAEVLQLASGGEQVLTREDDEALVLAAVTAEALDGKDAVLLAGTGQGSRRALEVAPARVPFIDVSGALEDHPEARISGPPAGERQIRIVPHPAAITIFKVLATVHAAEPLVHAVVLIFEPASERGQAGINELQQQTSELLSFRPLEKQVYDAQVSFNVLPRYGADAPLALDAVEQRIEKHLATLLAGTIPMPSLKLVQVPVFHGHSFSFWLEFAESPSPERLTAALEKAGFDVRGPDLEAPTNVGAAGQSGLSISAAERDRGNARAIWLWAASDNLRVAADAALDILQGVVRR